ncbi:MAG: tetratricopeptide repeat protein [Pseudomonadota bacterium]
MKSLPSRKSILVVLMYSLIVVWGASTPGIGLGQQRTAVQIVAPDGLSTKIYSQPSQTSEMLDVAFNGAIHEVLGTKDDFIAINLPDAGVTGYVLKEHTRPWEVPKDKGLLSSTVKAVLIAIAAVLGIAGIVFFITRARKAKVAEARAVSIPASIKRAEELFREGDYSRALKEFRSFLDLHGGEVRNPDVYRRMSVCCHGLGEFREAARAWEKMRSLGGLRDREDHILGASLMMALGKEAEAALIYEDLLESEEDHDTRIEIHTKLFHTYRRLKEPAKLLTHAMELIESGGGEAVFNDTLGYLVSEGHTDTAIQSNNKTLIKAVCEELLEMKAMTPEAARVYLKALEYDRTDKRLHTILSQIYSESGDYRKAVSELIILNQLDKGQSDEYMAQAARIYVENAKVHEALAEGNPIVIKKIAQIYLARSEVNPDAVAVYEKVLEFQPKAVGINKMLSTVYLTKGDLEAYMGRLRVLHEIDGTNHDYLSDLARCIVDNDLVDQTIREGNRDLNSRILRQLIRQGSSDDQSVALFEKLSKIEPNNSPLRGALVHAYGLRGEYAKQLGHMLSLISLKPQDKELLHKATDMAVEHNLLKMVADGGGNAIVHLTALKLVNNRIDNPEAREILEKAARLNPTDPVIAAYVKGLKAVRSQTLSPPSRPKPPMPRPEVPGPAPARSEPPAADVKSPRTGRAAGEDKSKPANNNVPARPAPAGEKRPSPRASGRKPLILPKEAASQDSGDGRGSVKHAAASPRGRGKPVSSSHETSGTSSKESARAVKSQPGSPAPTPAPTAEATRQPGQYVDLTSSDISFEEKAVTTFVSGYAKSMAAQYKREELFLPGTGGFAYKDLDKIFSDGWGDFHAGVEVNTGRDVLIRVFRKSLLEFPIIKDFVRQVSELGFNIVHENILPVQEAVAGPGGANGLIHPPYPANLEMVMERGKPFELAKSLEIFGKILESLSYAHSFKGLDGRLRRTFHLHLHPNQILVGSGLSDCKIVNLGYTQIFRNLTRAGRPRWQEPGMNPATMPPEFFRSRSAGIRERSSEVYSLGALLHFMVTGKYPFEGPGFDDYKFQHTRIQASPPRLTNPALPRWLDKLILRCLEKDPENRWESVSELQREFTDGLGSGSSE